MRSPRMMMLVVAVCAAVLACVVYFVVSARRQEKPPVVLGEELLRATQAEERRKARGASGASPVPAGAYEFSAEELGLINPRPNAFDAALSELCRRYARSDAAERARMRGSVSMEEFYTLLAFADRAAVFGLRERKSERLAEGLTAVAMIEQERVDFRDILMSLSLLHHSAARIADPQKLFGDAARLAEPATSKLILEFLARPAKEKDLRDAWGREEVETEGGVGFIEWGFQPYKPTSDLKKLSVEVARLLAADKYGPVSASVAEDFPPYWLEGVDDAALERALKTVRAGATVSAQLRPGAHPQAESQMFVVFVVELADESGARTLHDISKRKRPADIAMFGLAESRLFCLVVARAFDVGGKSFETTESLRRFEQGLAQILRRHAKS